MKITHDTLSTQPKEFVDMVTNAKAGDVYIYSHPNQIIFSYDINGVPQSTLFICTDVEPIITRFGSRDRILNGGRYIFDKNNEKIKFVEKTSVWCSQLADTDKYNGDINEYIDNQIVKNN